MNIFGTLPTQRIFVSFALFTLMAIQSFSFGQKQEGIVPRPVEWATFFENEFVRIDYKYANCDQVSEGIHKEEVYLQFTNKTDQVLSLKWALELHYGKKCFNCDGTNDEMKFAIDLSPNETIAGACSGKSIPQLTIFSKHLDFESSMILSDFKIKDLQRTSSN